MTAPTLYIGLMSGTSLDGIDAVVVDFDAADERLIAARSTAIPAQLRHQLLTLTQPGSDEIDRLGAADIQFAHLQADAVTALLAQAGIAPQQVRAIGSHGQTVRHRPGGALPFTLQLGDPNTLAERCGIDVIADFRRRDIAAGGQGAPLVPAFHAECFAVAEISRGILNLGGMANITVLPKANSAPVSGFDTGPANVLLDAWIQRHLQRPFDQDGHWAAQGQVNAALLSLLLSAAYFAEAPPKSTGREQFHIGWLDAQLATLGHSVSPVDVQATLLELTAVSVASAIGQLPLPLDALYLCGGGAHNQALLTRLQQLLPSLQLTTTAALGVDPDWVEAIAFAWLAKRFIDRKPGNLPAVTGASGRRVLGTLSPA